jgi:soluble lytic murein transglycosylase-like protein
VDDGILGKGRTDSFTGYALLKNVDGSLGSASGLSHCATGIRYGMMYLKMAYKKAGGNFYRAAILYNGGLGSKKKRSIYADKVHKKAYVKKAPVRTSRRISGVHDFGRDNGR